MGPAGAAGSGGSSDLYINSLGTGLDMVTNVPSQLAQVSNLPVGSYLVQAKVTLGPSGTGTTTCSLAVGASPTSSTLIDSSLVSGNVGFDTVALLGQTTISTAPGNIILYCTNSSSGASVIATHAVLTATQVASITGS